MLVFSSSPENVRDVCLVGIATVRRISRIGGRICEVQRWYYGPGYIANDVVAVNRWPKFRWSGRRKQAENTHRARL